MAEQRAHRRLAAILAADVVGCSRLMGVDEAGTLARLNAHRSELIDGKIAEFNGRVVKTTGDGLLAEFPSVVDALQCAADIQSRMTTRSGRGRRMEFRIDVNLGDIIIQDDDIFGDGVNVAARLEALADPGGICISGKVHDEVDGKLELGFEDLGPQEVKNIKGTIQVWRVHPEQAGGVPAGGARNREKSLPLPDKPSIAVLPFENLSGDPEQEYFADGISEDIITALSGIRWFFVIARNTTFAYKGQSPDIREVAAALGVRYVLEGSVRKSGNRVRITAQLIDGATGNHVWAKRYDRELEDIFDLQDELTETIVGAIEPELGKAEREHARAKRPENLRAWDLYQRAMWHTYRRTRDDLAEAQTLFAQARELDPDMAVAYAGAVDACFFQIVDGHAEDPETSKQEAVRLGRRAVDLDDRDAMARYALGRAYTVSRRHVEAIPELEAALELNPSFAQAHYALGFALATSGRPEDAIRHIERAIRLSPHDPYIGQFLTHIAAAHLFMHDHEEAVKWAREALRQPNIRWSRWALLVSALGHLGRFEEAAEAMDALHRLKPEVGVDFIEGYWPISHAPSLAHLVAGLRAAGVP